MIEQVKSYLINLQNNLCQHLMQLDSKAHFTHDSWHHSEGGGGSSRVLSHGAIFEKAGVNLSHIYGTQLPVAASAARPNLVGCNFQALGVSVVIHPQNPYVPTAHANVRFFMAETQDAPPIWWFGGGYDLTPYYGFDDDCRHWHQVAKAACDPFGAELYPKYKRWCDEYFYLKHRQEPRGIGGLFFDDVNQWDFATSFAFMQAIGNSFIDAYLPIVIKRHQHPYGEREKTFQQFRRGRYVEFNLLYDRGTLFGLQSGGRTESILMSLPPCVNWEYNWQPQPGSEEARLYSDYLVPRDWSLAPDKNGGLAVQREKKCKQDTE